MGYSPIIGRFLQRDPDPYIDSLNSYQFDSANPANSLDPMGLAPTTQPSIVLGREEFGKDYVKSGKWGSTDPKTHQITLDKLELPTPLPECLKGKQEELQKAVDKINQTASSHEKEAKEWMEKHPEEAPGTPGWKQQFQDSSWEHLAMHDMYSQLDALMKACKCDKDISQYADAIHKKLKYFYDQAVKDGATNLQNPDQP